MTTPNQDTLNLLKELKHKRFNSEIPYHHYPANTQPLVNPSQACGFVCSYHPTEFVTNICVSQQSIQAKPLCPRCLQNHINSHQLTSNPTPCKLEPCDQEVVSISQSLTQKLTSCHKIKQTISQLNKWQTVQLQQIQSNLHLFKDSLLAQVEKEFCSLQKQIQIKWQRHTKEYNETVKRLEQTMGNLEDHCQKSMKLIAEKKKIDTICASVPSINKKYEELVKTEEKILNYASSRIEGKFNTAKLSDIINSIKSSLQLKTNKVSGFEIDRILKEISSKQSQTCQKTQNTTLNKLQKLFHTQSTKVLQNLANNQQQKCKESLAPHNKIDSQKQTQWTVNSHERVLTKLNDTSNKLKESLSTFGKSNKPKIHA